MIFNFDLKEGDSLILNDRRWLVEEIDGGFEATSITMSTLEGDRVDFSKDDLQQSISFAGRVSHIREEYQNDDLITP